MKKLSKYERMFNEYKGTKFSLKRRKTCVAGKEHDFIQGKPGGKWMPYRIDICSRCKKNKWVWIK